MKKDINVFVDLFGEGIIDLPITYTISADKAKTDLITLSCSIEPVDDSLPGWLYVNHFEFIFSRTSNDDAVIVSVSHSAEKKNVYYELMLNVVFEYIWLREFSKEKQVSYAIH